MPETETVALEETTSDGLPVAVETAPASEPAKAVDTNGVGQTETKPSKTFTADDIEKARKEEKDKLYGRLQTMEEELKATKAEREAREKAAKDAEKTAAAEAKKRAEEELSAKELLTQKEAEWEQRFQTIEADRQRSDALLDQERKFASVMDYKTRRLTEEAETIMPELRDYVTGMSEEEIEASLASAIEKTARIVGNIQQATQQQRQQQRGASVTSPPVGPLEQNNEGYETMTADDIRGMDMATYAKNRDRLIKAAKDNRNKGLFG